VLPVVELALSVLRGGDLRRGEWLGGVADASRQASVLTQEREDGLYTPMLGLAGVERELAVDLVDVLVSATSSA
jgi:hypothetical protein